ncbi:MAG: DUF2141 domain-containing protein [Aliiglaciecola sp.]
MNPIKFAVAAVFFNAVCSTSVIAKKIDFLIDGVKAGDGKIYVQLFKGKTNYESGNAEAATVVSALDGKATVSFHNLDTGEYALRYFHDENNNGEMETNLLGMPTEGYGFSNSAKPNFGPVSYEEIMFELDESQTSVSNSSSVIY